jgi:Glycosyltransferase family 87
VLKKPVFAKNATQSWLTSRRIRRQALLLAIALWVGYAVNMSAPGLRDRFGHLKGTDFLHAYILGTLASNHLGDALYDPRIQRDIGDARVPESSGDYFLPVYGPQYSLFWLPFAKLPYPWAAAIWIFVSAAIYAACCYAVWQTCRNLQVYEGTVALLAVAFPGFYELINFGQNSALALACFTGMYFALRARRELLAGLCLGLLAYKPQLGLVPACVFLACLWPRKGFVDRTGAHVETRPAASPLVVSRPAASRIAALRVLFGAALAIGAQIGVAWLWYGCGPLLNYARVVMRLGSAARILEPRPYLMHSLRAFWDLLLPWPNVALALYIPTAVAAIVLAIVCWRRPIPLESRFAIMLLATVLVAPHLTVYDLVILAPAFLWIADWLQSRVAPLVAWLLYLSYILFFAGPLSRWTHLQISVISLSMLFVIFSEKVWRESAA